MRIWGLVWIGLIGLVLPGQTSGADKWLYVSRNLQVDKSVEELDQLMQRGAAAGYTKMLLADSKFSRLGDVIDRYFDNVEKVKQLVVANCTKHGHLEIPELRDALGTTRKYLIPLLEYFDSKGVTTRLGANRVLKKR